MALSSITQPVKNLVTGLFQMSVVSGKLHSTNASVGNTSYLASAVSIVAKVVFAMLSDKKLQIATLVSIATYFAQKGFDDPQNTSETRKIENLIITLQTNLKIAERALTSSKRLSKFAETPELVNKITADIESEEKKIRTIQTEIKGLETELANRQNSNTKRQIIYVVGAVASLAAAVFVVTQS